MSDNTEVINESTADADAVAAAITSQDRPEYVPEKFWDSEKKEVRTEAALKSYGELERRFGAFKGAPDDYTITLSENLANEGLSVDTTDPVFTAAKEFAKNANMSQDGFNGMVELYAMQKLAEHKAEQAAMAADIASLGDNADRRIHNLEQWAGANLDQELLEGFKDMAISARAVRAMERIVSMTRNAPVSVNNASPSTGVSEAEVREMQFAKDEHGNRRIQTDPAFRAEYERKLKQAHGEEPFRQIIG